MGFLDALSGGYFKTAPDGRRLFFPWGALNKGYVIASEEDYLRLRRKFRAYSLAGFVLIVGAVVLHAYLWAFVAATLLAVVHWVWARRLVRGLQPSTETLSLKESMTLQARAHSAWGLWLLTAASLALVIASIAIVIIDPGNWLVAASGAGFFGLCAAGFLHMLNLRRHKA